MYSPSIIKAKLQAIQLEIDSRPFQQQFKLRYLTIKESQIYTEFLTSILNPDYISTIENAKGKLPDPKVPMFIRDLSQEELNFIENERTLCQNDFMYWSTHYVWIESVGITSELSKTELFKPLISQKMLIAVLGNMEEKLIAILVQILKARQLGASTLVMLIICHRILYQTFVKALVGSSDPDKTSEMTHKIRFTIQRLPLWLKPLMKMSDSTKEEIWVDIPSLDNRIIRQHGTSLSGIGRGNTPTIAHLSEIPDFSDPDESINASLIPAMHENPNCFLVLESTAKGDSGYWPRMWRFNVENLPRGRSKLFPLFFPWFVGTDIYPTKTWERKCPIPNNWTPSKETIAHAERCADYAKHEPLLREFLGSNYILPKRQQYYYEVVRKEAEELGTLSKFLEEHPATPEEAFQVSGRSIFTLAQIEEMKNRAKPLALYHGKPAVFALIGTDILSDHEPDLREIDTDRPPIEIVSDILEGQNKATYRLLPLHFESSMLSPLGLGYDKTIFIWEFPFTLRDRLGKVIAKRPPNTEYGLGNDNSEGLGLDKTAINIIRKGSIFEYSEQVCEFATKWISANELLPWMDCLGAFYSKWTSEITNECKMVIEVPCGGAGLQHRLIVDRGWFNFHRWEGAMDTPHRKKIKGAKLGWETNRHTRPWLVGDVARDIKDGFLLVNSPFLIRECQTLQKEDEEAKIEAKGDANDDNFFAAAMAHFSLSIWDIRKRIESKYLGKPLANSLNDMYNQVEKSKREVVGKVDHYLWPSGLPTLDDIK